MELQKKHKVKMHYSNFILLICLLLTTRCSCKSESSKSNQERKQDESIAPQGYSEKDPLSATLYTIEAQPRMYTNGGHLFFQTGTSYNINFKTAGSGKVNLNDMDLTNIANQVQKNQDDINDIQQTGGGTLPPGLQDQVDQNTDTIGLIQDQINQHNTRLDKLDTDVTALQSDVSNIKSDLSKNDCSNNPCQHGGTCIDLYNSYLCQCVDQWQGQTCSQDVNECSKFASSGWGCQNGGTCVNSPGSFSCTCPPEFFGSFCTSKYDDCTDGSSKCQHGICVDSPRDQTNVPQYTCVCEDGWQTVSGSSDPACSQDVNECIEKPCSKNPEVTCYNNPGSYSCGPCPSGYIGNGWACTDINECATNNGGCSTSPLVTCINTAGSSTCGPCPSGYTGDGKTCTTQDACAANNGGCHPIATCAVNPAVGSSSVTCTCPQGYTGNGFGPNGCTLLPTDCTGTCQNGQCLDVSGTQVCTCDPGWGGVSCDTNIDECVSSPCQHGGTCMDAVNGYFCDCTNNYGGKNCETDQSGCGGYFKQDSGSFSLPSDTSIGNYPNGVSCGWVIEVSLGKVIQATFPLFDIELSTDCVSDFLQIHDGNSASAHQIGKYCGSTKPGDPLVSTHNLLYFWFLSNSQVSGEGFQVVWQPRDPECGADITGLTYGDIQSPGYPGDYPANRDCYWTIQVQPGNVVQLLFGTLALETHENCTFDFLEVRNGLSDTDPVLARYCSTMSPPPLVSTAPGVWIYFHSDPYVSDTGFHIVWSSQPVDITGCGGYFSDDDGIIISPNWPNPYDQNQECFWQIHVGQSGQILLNFTHMDIEDHENCEWDYVEVRDGPDETAPLVARHCGQQLPPAYTSSSNNVWMKFRSDEAQTGSGFRATYTVACGGTYTAESGVLLSPYYPSRYPDNKDCFYLIRQVPGHVITLTFTDFSLEHEADCNYDYIEVRDGPSEDSPLLAKLCGNSVPVPIMSTQNYMWVHFSTDPFQGGSGFKANYISEFTGCGGVYTDPVGSLQSPGHPSPYPHGANCTYFIAVDPAFIINLQFIAFSLQATTGDGTCVDYVELFDGESITSPSLGRYCGSITPPLTVSSSYHLTLFFSADNSINSDGFAAAYSTINSTTACGKRLTENQGLVSSPNYPNNYYDMKTCIWTLTVDSSMQIQVNFTDFILEGKNGEGVCVFDYLEIRNGGYDDSALIGQYCGTDSPGSFTTHSNQLYMKLSTDPFVNDRGFLMEYDGTLTGCGGTLTSADGYFQSPNYPFSYNHNSECFWLIQVSEGSAIRLTFTTFDIETHGYCEFDYVEVYDGPTIGYPSLGRQCGSRLPPPYESSDNSMLVRFRSDEYTAGTGFLAQYHVECSRTITAKSSGYIQSLDFPNSYPPNRDCTWKVQGTMGNRINVTFTYFAMETCDDCSCDYVQLYDGADVTSDPSLGKFCNEYPGPFRTASNNLAVVFHSDPYLQSPGFEILWAVDGCGDTRTEPTGTITSPNYPNNYDDNRECIWQITTSPGTSVELTITMFDVEHHQQCDYDVLEIYNGLSVDSSYQLAKLCNAPDNSHSLPMVVTSTSTFMTLRFLTDAFVNGKGFSSTYKEVAGACGGSFVALSGSIMSPNYPNNYASMQDCEWYINVGEGKTVMITFEAFDIEPEPLCDFDYVAIYDGKNMSAALLLKACGSSLPAPVRSTGHNVLFQFHSDPYSTHTGFKANFDSACGGKITISQDGEISSPNYPNVYPADTNCTWILQAPITDGRVSLTFTHMDLYYDPYTNASVCGSYDYIEILDGPSLSSPSYKSYCGTSLPAPITSMSNAFTLTMYSKSLYQRTGFRALYTTSTSRCGGDLTAQSGYFNSPGYPNPYPPDSTCVWTIKSSPGNGIHLRFISFDLEDHVACLFDYVQIREGSVDGPILAQVCGSEIPSNLTTIDGHVLYVKFVSDLSGVGYGFQAAYQHTYGSVSLGSFSGIISSPMYPGVYPNLVDAYYYVYAPVGRIITYHFLFFEFEQATDAGCEYDFLAIYDGDTTSFPLLFLGCGTDFLPPDGATSQGAMLMWFHSDWGAYGRGFYMTWEAADGAGIPPNPTNVPTASPGSCGSNHLVAAVYPIYIVSPGWPGVYPNNLNCMWVIEAAEGYRVSATVPYIDIENIGSCEYDYLAFYNGPNITSPELGRYCGRRGPPGPVASTGTYMTILFTSDNSVGYAGFNVSYQQACGGVVQGDIGAITSPNYPNNYPVSTTCDWEIISTIGSNMTLTFESPFMVANSDAQCGDVGDYVMLLNGRDMDSPPLNPNGGNGNGRYCGSTPPQDLGTLSNGLFVRFRSDGTTIGAGFKMTFTSRDAACGSRLLLTDDVTSATFTSPNYPNAYPLGIDCYWLISCPPTESVQLDFTAFQLEQHPNCDYDFVMVNEGHTGDGQVLGKFCGSDQPPTTKSIGNEMSVRFRSDAFTAGIGFQATYSIAACGGTLVGTSGTIISPNYPMNYPTSTSCLWVVRGPIYHFVSFTFNALNLAVTDGSTCGDGTGDYIEIRSDNFTGPVLKTVCGVFIPLSIDTLTNEAYVTFKSDASDVSSGFSMNFVASEDACGADLENNGGTISTPNFPNSYDHSRSCTWNIKVADDRSVTLTFNTFNIENPYEDGVCYFDYVEVFNGINSNSPSISGRRCGGDMPPPYTSSGNTMKVVFSTDASVANGGFLATYDSNQPRGCGGRLNLPGGGNFSSPNYPKPYNNRMECIWTIENPNPVNSTIYFQFEAFALENHVECQYDYLAFTAGSIYDGYPVATLCGRTKPASFGIPFVEANAQFISDPYTTDTGFLAKYSFTACGGLVTGTTSGVITSPNFPDVYNHNDYCLWTIAVTEGHKINLHWTDFIIEQHNSCVYDYLKLYNGPTIDSPLIDTYCGTNAPTEFQSGTNTVTILFQSDFSVSAGGWRVEWSADNSGCGNIIYHDHAGTITSPGYPGNYPRNADCVWSVIADPAYHIEVTFDQDFYIEYHDGCQYDYVALFDGTSEFSPEISRFCGTFGDVSFPTEDPTKSSLQDLALRFRSDFSTERKGFKANWLAKCGQDITAESGTIQSPSFPSAYNINEYCEFLITYESEYKFIKLTFSSFNVEAGSTASTCDFDYVRVYGDPSPSSGNRPVLGTFCGNLRPTTPLSSEGSMLVAFKSDEAIVDYGFEAAFESADCGGMLTDSSGSINAFTHSDIHDNRNCTWQISVSPPEKIVELKFSSFDLEAHSGCLYDNVKVYDGIDTHAPLIGTFCGTRVPNYIISTGNTMTIEYVTDDIITGDGFTAAYRAMTGPAEGCGGTIEGTEGSFSSPDLDNSGEYDANLNCLWIIQSPVNTDIKIRFDSFKLENGSAPGVCIYDRVEIRDGSTEYDPLVLTACGINIPANYQSTGNTLFFRFISDPLVEDTGFTAVFKTQPQICGGYYDVTESYTHLPSPVISTSTQAFNCRWTLDAGTVTDRYIEITFDSIDIQSSSNSVTSCIGAYVELRDYPLGDYGQVFRYCGSDLPPDFYSLDQIVQVNFRTDVGATGAGFGLRYKLATCSRTISQNHGQLFSPGWPDPYVHGLSCETVLQVDSGNKIQLFFNYFDVEFENNCNFDYLEVRNGSTADSEQLQRLCGNYIPDPIFPLNDALYMKLASDPYIVGNGYDITYTSSPSGCGGNITGDHGSVYSEMYPQPYAPNMECIFIIRSPAGRPITVHITYIDIYYACNDNGCFCGDDLLWIYGGPSTSAVVMGIYCGRGTLSDLKSPTNAATIRFVTGDFIPGSRTNAGFRVKYES